jgi:hypothetical protein
MAGCARACLVALAATQLYAQTLTCDANAGVPPVIRSEGRVEAVGDVLLVCTATSAAAPAPFDIVVSCWISSSPTLV